MTMTIEMAWRAEAVDETVHPDHEAAIRRCLLDYFEGWFDGDAERMDRALHPGLSKHSLRQDADRSEALDVTTKDEMVDATRRGQGVRRDLPDRAIRIEIAGVSGDIASAIVHSAVYIEYALLARSGDGWQITSTLWRWASGHGPRA
jgi:putative lumazine-binding protein